MPYVMPAIHGSTFHSRRYGTWDLLRKPRTFKLIHQHWTFARSDSSLGR